MSAVERQSPSRSPRSTARPRTQADESLEISKALWKLLAGGKPRFPMVASEFGLAPQQLHLLRVLHDREQLSMRQVAELLFCDASNVTAIVDRLEERGLIERRPDPNDRRVKLIVATPRGRKLQEQALAKLYEPLPGIEALPASDRRALRKLLARAVELQATSGES